MPNDAANSRGPKKQHYVPQFLLRGFADSKERIFVFDKETGQVRHQSVRDVGHENKTYEVRTDAGKLLSLEARLASLEGKCAPIIARLLSPGADVAGLRNGERAAICLFTAVQMLRVPHTRKNMLAINDLVLREMTARFGRDGIDKNLLGEMENFDSDGAKKVSLSSIVHNAPELARHIHAKRWVLQTATGAKSLYIGDNPVSRMNHISRPHRGNLGLKCDGIEVYLPLSPRATLAFLDPIWVDLMAAYEQRAGRCMEAEGWKQGKAELLDANVTHLNSLQVIEAERFIFSPTDDFDLVREMLVSNPELKIGPRMQLM